MPTDDSVPSATRRILGLFLEVDDAIAGKTVCMFFSSVASAGVARKKSAQVLTRF